MSKNRDEFYLQLLQGDQGRFALIQYLDNSFCDEIVYASIKNDTFNQLYHVNGKYFVPEIDSQSYRALFDFSYQYIVHPDDKEIFKDLMSPDGMFEKLENSFIPHFRYARYRFRLENGNYRWVEQCLITGKEYGLEEGEVKFYVFDIQHHMNRESGKYVEEMTELDKREDSLTGLLYEKAFFLKAQEIINNNPSIKWSMLSIDVEHFTLFYEWYGREKGDLLLSKMGETLKNWELEKHGLAGYFGKDDFGLLIPYNEEDISKLYDEIRNIIKSSQLSIGFMPAFGVAIIDGISAVEAFNHAAVATTKSKNDIKNRITYYNEEMHKTTRMEYNILSEFMQALNNHEITFYLQPQCRISTGKIVSAESLARWIKKDGTIIGPGDFIPILEKYGFIIDLDIYLWEEAIAWLRKFIDKGNAPFPLSLNVSRADMYSINIVNHFIELAKKYNIPHNLIKLEITESAYIERTTNIKEIVKVLRNRGFTVMMDDFGSGYSSLNMLSSFKVDAIKLDQNFLKISEDEFEKGVHILESIVNMTKVLSIPIIVEGAETREQVDFLEELGVRYVQGYYFYKPMPPMEFEQIVSNPDNIDERGFIMKQNEQFRLREFLDRNVYSDTMLNNIIGAVAFYSLHDDCVDIIRYNQQFYESVNVPDFDKKITSIQNVMPEKDRDTLFELLRQAKKDRLTGSSGILRFYRVDGTIARYIMRFYYIGKKDGSDRFYGSANNVTKLSDLEQRVQLINKYVSDSVIFMKWVNGEWKFEILALGMARHYGASLDTFQKELNERTFHKRIIDDKEAKDFSYNVRNLMSHKNDYELTTDMINDKGDIINITFTFIHVEEENNNADYILTIRVNHVKKE